MGCVGYKENRTISLPFCRYFNEHSNQGLVLGESMLQNKIKDSSYFVVETYGRSYP